MSQKTNVSRRSFLKTVAAGAGAVSTPAVLTACGSDDDDRDFTVFAFGHGVASGDPLADRVIIWTRVTPDNAADAAEVSWKVAADAEMSQVVASGSVITDKSRDFTVKVDATGLDSDTTYYYQFTGDNGVKSPLGTTRTLPVGAVNNVKLAVCSCANFPYGMFNVYKEIADSDAQAVVHLGDYIYEYKAGEYPAAEDVAAGRQEEIGGEIITLEQYRARYSLYRRDQDLQAAHAAKPFICVWDDHELANDAYKGGAQNHNDGEGSFAERRAAAFQAYHEWLPIRTGADNAKIWRGFEFGNLVNLTMLDTRQFARDKSLSYDDYISEAGIDQAAFAADLGNLSRTLLGDEQQQFADASVRDSNATWQVLGQQILMGHIKVPTELLLNLGMIEKLISAGQDASAAQQQTAQLLGELAQIKGRILQGDPSVTDAEKARVETVAPYNLDAWDGYPVAREKMLRLAQYYNKNLVVLAGDTHNAWASNLYPAFGDKNTILDGQDSVGVEFATSSVSSPGFETYVGFGSDAQQQAGFEQVVTTLVDNLQYMNAANRGYMLVEFTPQKASSEWRFVTSVDTRSYTTFLGKKMEVSAGQGNRTLVDVTPSPVA